MSNKTKTFFAACGIAFAVGLVLTCVGFATGGIEVFSEGFVWNHGKFVKVDQTFETTEESYDSIKTIDLNLADRNVEFKASNDQKYRIEYNYSEQAGKPEIVIKKDKLTFNDRLDSRAIVGWNVEKTQKTITVYYPKNAKFDVIKISSQYGDVDMNGLECDYMHIALDCGDFYAEDITTKKLEADNEYGEIEIHGDLLKTSEISSDDGDIILYLKGTRSLYSYKVVTQNGDVSFDKEEIVGDDYSCNYEGGHGRNKLNITNEYGDIELHFSQK